MTELPPIESAEDFKKHFWDRNSLTDLGRTLLESRETGTGRFVDIDTALGKNDDLWFTDSRYGSEEEVRKMYLLYGSPRSQWITMTFARPAKLSADWTIEAYVQPHDKSTPDPER